METHISNFCQQMTSEGMAVTLVMTSRRLHSTLIEAMRASGVIVKQFDCLGGKFRIVSYVNCCFYAWKNRKPDQVFYSHGRTGFAWLIGKIIRAKLWVHHHHDDANAEILPTLNPPYQRVLKVTDWVIACTPVHAREIDSYFQRNNRTVCLPYLKTEPTGEIEYSQKASKEKTVVGYFGRLITAKGVKTLIGMASWFSANRIKCRFYGTDTEGIMAQGLPNGMSWQGVYNSEADLDKLMGEVHMLLLPTTFYEGLPIVMCEAISRGVPVVAYDGGGLRDVKNLHPGLIVLSPDLEAFKAAILKTSDNLLDPNFKVSLQQFYFQNFGNAKTLQWWNTLLQLS